VGGQIVESPELTKQLLKDFAEIESSKILVHGGGKIATQIAGKLGIESRMVNGRRITDSEMLDVVTMVYGGLVNKKVVAALQAINVNAIGLTGADLNFILSEKRPVTDVDYGFAGDIKQVNTALLRMLLLREVVPVLAPLTHDKSGNLLNTNADTIAAETAKAFARDFDVTLVYCFEKKGVLLDPQNDDSVIAHIDSRLFEAYKAQGIVSGGMLPKLQNAFDALHSGVKKVIITRYDKILNNEGTVMVM
jgi:acetylglutamate kinase